MKINRMNYSQVISKLEKNRSVKTQVQNESPKDSITISDESIKLNEYLKNLKTDESDKVEQIKAKMAAGTYKVDSGKLAEKILDRMKAQDNEE